MSVTGLNRWRFERADSYSLRELNRCQFEVRSWPIWEMNQRDSI